MWLGSGKTACNADYLIDEGDNHSPITQVGTYTYDTPSPRNNRDDNAADGQGKMILEICKALNMTVDGEFNCRPEKLYNLNSLFLNASLRPLTSAI